MFRSLLSVVLLAAFCSASPVAACSGALGPPVGGMCPDGYSINSGFCCPSSGSSSCSDPLGPPLSGMCPTGYSVKNNLCCAN